MNLVADESVDFTIGGFIHVLLVIAIIAILIRLIRGEKVL